MKHPDPFPEEDLPEDAAGDQTGRRLRWILALKVVVVALILIGIVALHLAGIVGMGRHFGG